MSTIEVLVKYQLVMMAASALIHQALWRFYKIGDPFEKTFGRQIFVFFCWPPYLAIDLYFGAIHTSLSLQKKYWEVRLWYRKRKVAKTSQKLMETIASIRQKSPEMATALQTVLDDLESPTSSPTNMPDLQNIGLPDPIDGDSSTPQHDPGRLKVVKDLHIRKL